MDVIRPVCRLERLREATLKGHHTLQSVVFAADEASALARASLRCVCGRVWVWV